MCICVVEAANFAGVFHCKIGKQTEIRLININILQPPEGRPLYVEKSWDTSYANTLLIHVTVLGPQNGVELKYIYFLLTY